MGHRVACQVGTCVPNYVVSLPKDCYIHIDHCQNPNSLLNSHFRYPPPAAGSCFLMRVVPDMSFPFRVDSVTLAI